MAPKTNNSKSGKAIAHKRELREEAETRQEARDERSNEEQLEIIGSRPGASIKERKRFR